MGYCTYITRAGYELQAKLFAEGGDFRITRVEVGRGVCPPDQEPSLLTGLVEPMAVATSTKPRRVGCEVSLSVEYRSDLNGELEEAFQINEYGVFAQGVDGSEILLLYGDLSDYPESAVPQKYGGCVRRYPINVTIGPDASASLAYPAGAWMTCEEVDEAIEKGLREGLALEDGGTVGEAVNGMRRELEAVKESLKNEDGTPIRDAIGQLEQRVEEIGKAVEAGDAYRVFEPSDWTGNELRYDASDLGLEPGPGPCVYTLRQRVGRTALEYDGESAGPVAGLLIAAVKAALDANTVPEPEAPAEDADAGTEPEPEPAAPPLRFPTGEDGHVIFTWEQVQYLLLESNSFQDEGVTVWNPALVGAEEAETLAAQLGFNWRERDNGAAETVTLDALLTAAYLPALGGPSTNFEAMVTAEALQGLRFRRGVGGDGYVAEYDLDGVFVTTWGTMSAGVCWEPDSSQLVVSADAPFAGDILVSGRGGAGG